MIRSTMRRLTGRRWPEVRTGEKLSCTEVGLLVQRYLDGELESEAEIDALAAHLGECRRCGVEAETYQKIKDALGDRSVEAPQDSVDRLRQFGANLLERN